MCYWLLPCNKSRMPSSLSKCRWHWYDVRQGGLVYNSETAASIPEPGEVFFENQRGGPA